MGRPATIAPHSASSAQGRQLTCKDLSSAFQILEWLKARTVPNLSFSRLWKSKVTQYPKSREQNLSVRLKRLGNLRSVEFETVCGDVHFPHPYVARFA